MNEKQKEHIKYCSIFSVPWIILLILTFIEQNGLEVLVTIFIVPVLILVWVDTWCKVSMDGGVKDE